MHAISPSVRVLVRPASYTLEVQLTYTRVSRTYVRERCVEGLGSLAIDQEAARVERTCRGCVSHMAQKKRDESSVDSDHG